MFVATANDRATEKDCLFLELRFSLKEIKINIEKLFFFFFFYCLHILYFISV